MTKKWMLGWFGGVSGIVLAATLVQSEDLTPMVVLTPTGSLVHPPGRALRC